MNKFKAAFALLAVFVILAAPAYAEPASAGDGTGTGVFQGGTDSKGDFTFRVVEPGSSRETGGKEQTS